MPYRLRGHETLSESLRRLAAEQAGRARKELQDEHLPAARAVHQARKRFKKIRSVLRLSRDGLGEKVYKAENGRFRDLGKALAGPRDAEVAVETLDDLLHRCGEWADEPELGRLRKALVLDRDRRVREGGLDEKRHRVLDRLPEAEAALAGLPLPDDAGFEALAPGLKRIHRRGRKRFAEVRDAPTFEAVHEWRKRVKDLWYFSRILHPLWPPVIGGLETTLDELSDILGDHHDLAVLQEAAAAREAWPEALGPLIERRRSELEAAVLAPGLRVYADKPKPFVKRLERYWEAWQQAP